MIKKFSKRQLLDQCGFNAEETQIILDYQKKLPILVENDSVEGFCIDARDLWKQLGEPQGKFADWIKRKIKWIIYKLDGLVPKIHNLPDVVYIKWMGEEFIIKK